MARQNPKFRELILYLAKLSEADPKCGRTKLNKLLFYCDFRAYDYLGAAISGERYQRRDFGPTPGSLLPAVEELERERACAWADRTYHGRPAKKLIALREPDLRVFSPQEVDLIRDTVAEFASFDASEISERSHQFSGWQSAEPGGEIPYRMAFVDDARPLSQEEEEWALQALQEDDDAKVLAG